MVYLGNLERKDNPSTPLGRIAPFKGGISPKDLKHSRESSTLHPKKSLHWCIGKTTEKRFYFNSPVYICSAVPRAAQASITSAVKSSQKSAEETQQMQQLHQKQMHTCQKKRAIQKCRDAEHILFPMVCRLLACWSLKSFSALKLHNGCNVLQVCNISKEVTESAGISLLHGWRV